MSDTDTNFDGAPEDPSNFILADQRRTIASAMPSATDDPDAAARSMELGKATGDSPALIYPNLENYEQQHKAGLTAFILSNNKYLRSYIDADPMHAKISADDWGTLDENSDKLLALMRPSPYGDFLKRVVKKYTEGVGTEPLGSSAFRTKADQDFARDHPFPAAIGAGFASIGELMGRPVSGALKVLEGETGSREPSAMLEWAMMRGDINIGGEHAHAANFDALREAETGKAIKLREMAAAGRPFADAEADVPAGVHPEYDKLKFEQNRLDLDNLDEAFKSAQSSATRERNPDAFASFIRQHSDGSIGIDGRAVAQLYGDKLPAVDDGILGFVPDLADQLETAKAVGGDVRVPIADWLAKADPEVAKELHDFIRVRPGGITKGEREAVNTATDGVEGYKAPEPLAEPLPLVRGSAALEPLFSVGDRKLELQRMKDTDSQFGKEQGFHDFDILDEQGKTVGSINLSEQKGGKELYIDMINGVNGRGPRDFGPALMRDLFRQLREEFPDADTLGGHRVSGVRDRFNTYNEPHAMWKLPMSKFEDIGDPRFGEAYKQMQEIQPGVYGKPIEMTPEKQKVVDAVNEVLDRVVPKAVGTEGFDRIQTEDGARKGGVYTRYEDSLPWISWSLESPNPVATARHEAIHHLRQYGFFTEGEWSTLSRAARDGDWVKQYRIEERYGDQGLSHSEKLEESIADAFKRWAEKPEIDSHIGKVFTRIKAVLDAIREKLKSAFGGEANWEELFQKVESGEVGSREPGGLIDERAFAAEESHSPSMAKDALEAARGRDNEADILNARGRSIAYDRQLAKQRGEDTKSEEFAGTRNALSALRGRLREMGQQPKFEELDAPLERGTIMPKDQFDRYMKLIADRHAEDLASATKRAEREQAKRQTAEWKANESTERTQAHADIIARPDIAADLFLGVGDYLGSKMGAQPRLRAEDLSAEQKSAIPRHYYAKEGFHPDEVANLFGYPTGDAMIEKLADLRRTKDENKLTTRELVEKMVDAETESRMQQKYGDLGKSILDEAKDQATSETQLNLLHEETLALALQNGHTGKIDKTALASWVKEKFDATPVGGIKMDDYLASAGKAGRAAEVGLLKGDYAEAFQAKQSQYLAMLFAKEAKGFEKSKAQFDKLATRYSRREVAGASPEYTTAVHDILQRLGEKVRRSIQDVQEGYKLDGYKDLGDFVSAKEGQLRDLHTPDFLTDPTFRKPTDQLTAQEFEQVHDALKAITHNSRDELKVTAAGEKADLETVLGEMIDNIKSLGEPKPHPREAGVIGTHVKNYWWAGITVESMLHRLDRGDRSGPFYQYITHHFTEASNYKDRLIKQFQSRIAEVGKIEGMDKQVENTIFKNPDTGEMFPLRRREVLGILQNVGNKNNLMKLAKGYDLEPSAVLDWLHHNTTKEDWDRAQKIGDIFKDIFDMANTMSHNISGVGLQRLPLEPLDTPHGTYGGWYNPIKYDSFIPGKSRKLMGPNALEEEGFYRATTPQGYTKDRTGYIAPVDLSLDIVPQRMKQMLHDIAMRPAVLQMSKFFYDNRFQRAMNNYYGVHQAQSLIPFLQDIANAPNFKSMTAQLGNQAVEFMRQNMIATLIGFNPGTVMKHGTTAWINSMTEVGAKNYLREFKNIVAETFTGRDTWKMALEKSEELQRRMRNFQELMEGHGSEINIQGARNPFMSLREMVTNAGAKPVSISDLLSAVPTWAAKYKTELANGTDEGMAVSLANAAVRAAHGSSTLSNKPAIARTNALGATFSSLYGFFSHMQQKQYQLAWQARDMLSGQRDVAKTIPDLVGGLFSYVIAPAVIEELVTPSTTDDHKSWGRHAAETLGMGVSSSFIGIRDFVRALVNVRDPQAGLVGTSIKTMTDLGRDLSKGSQAFTKEKAGNLIKHTFALGGALTGLANEQEGKMAEYMYRYSKGMEKPKGLWDAGVGLRYGTTDKHSHSFGDWQKQTLGGK